MEDGARQARPMRRPRSSILYPLYSARMDLAFTLNQTLYWLALSTWFGGVLFVAVAAPIIFRTVRESNPMLPTVLSVNLEGQHGTLLAGSIVANLLRTLTRVELVCAAVLLITVIGQWLLIRPTGPNLIQPIVRSALLVIAIAIVVYDWRVLWPKVWEYRQKYIEHADDPDVANPAKDEFDRYHQDSVRLLSILLAVLLAMVLFSGNIRQAGITLTMTGN